MQLSFLQEERYNLNGDCFMHENIRKNLGYWESFDDTDGLGHHCRSFLADRDGYIWVATGSGLSRYDGKGFINLTDRDGLKHIDLHGMILDKENNMWIGTMGGLHCYDGKEFTRFGVEDGLISDRAMSVCQHSDGSIWIGTVDGLSRYDGKQFTNFSVDDGLVGNTVNCIYPDRDGNIWIGTDAGICLYDGEKIISFPDADLPNYKGILCIYQDKYGIIWIGTIRGLIQYDGKEFSRFSSEEHLGSISIRCVYQDRDDNIWIGTGGDGVSYGVSCYDGKDIVTLGISGSKGLASTNVHDIIQDREGNYWFACDHGGISIYNPYEFTHISDEPVEEIMAKDRSGNLWWGSRDTIAHFDGENIEHHPIGYKVFSILEDTKGQFWVSTDHGGVFKYDSKESLENPERMTGQDMLSGESALVVYEDNQGNIWIGCNNGLNRYDGHSVQTFTAEDGLSDSFVSNIFQDTNGTLWFQGWANGITSYDGKQFRVYTSDDGMLDNCVTCMSETDGNHLWIGTRIGMDCFDGKSFKHYTTKNGLAAEFVQRIIRDSQGHLWIATLGGGISRYDGVDFQALTTTDGLPSNNVTGIVENSDGSMSISTYKGICRYVPDYVTAPLLRIDEVDADRVYSRPKSLQISRDISSIRIRYHGISFKTKRMRYRYILEGYDKDWVATWDEEVRYENLPEGEYTFRVIAINKDLVCSEELAELKLEVLADPREEVISELGRQVEEEARKLEEMRSAKDYMDNVIKSMADTLIIATPDGMIYAVNQAALNLLGYAEDELVGKPLETVIAEDNGLRKAMPDILLNMNSAINVEKNYQAKDGSKIPVLFSSSIIRDNSDQTQGIVCVAQDITERKKVEAELRKQVQRNTQILQTIMDGYLLVDINGKLIDVNAAYCELVGYSREELIGMNLHDLELESSHRDWTRRLQSINYGGDRFEAKHVTRDGSILDLEVSIVIAEKGGSNPLIVGFVRDITERKRSEEISNIQKELSASLNVPHDLNETLKLCLDAAIKVAGMDSGGIYLVDNKNGSLEMAFHTGLSAEFVEVASHFDAQSPNAHIVMVGKPVYTQHKKMNIPRQEGIKALAIIPISNEGEVVACLNIASHTVNDIPNSARATLETLAGQIGNAIARTQAEQALKENEQKYRELVENANSIIMRMDTNGHITFFNEFAQSFFGYDADEIIGQNMVGTIVPKTDSAESDLADMIQNIGLCPDRYANNEAENIKHNGERVWVSWTNRPIRDNDENVTEILCIGNDVTELRATQRQFIQQERLRALGQLASGIAHDFNNTLTPVLGYSDLLLNVPSILDNKEKLTNHLEIIKTAAEDARSVVSRLREFYRVRDEAVTFGPVDLNQLIKETIQLTQPKWKDQAQANNVTIDVEMNLQEIPMINGSKNELREMLTNMVLNAVDAIPVSGTVSLSTWTDGDNVILKIRDTGTGMTQEAKQRCFDPFFSTKGERGTGLGLAMVYGTVQRHTGSITVNSEQGIGTIFIIQLPRIEARAEEIIVPEPQLKIKPIHALVVDDDSQVLETITQYLMADNHTYEAANNGREGLEKFRESKFDLVITDRAMPDMSGTQLATLLRQYTPDIHIIMITGFGELMKSSGEKVEHVDCILSKPITLFEFREALVNVIG